MKMNGMCFLAAALTGLVAGCTSCHTPPMDRRTTTAAESQIGPTQENVAPKARTPVPRRRTGAISGDEAINADY